MSIDEDKAINTLRNAFRHRLKRLFSELGERKREYKQYALIINNRINENHNDLLYFRIEYSTNGDRNYPNIESIRDILLTEFNTLQEEKKGASNMLKRIKIKRRIIKMYFYKWGVMIKAYAKFCIKHFTEGMVYEDIVDILEEGLWRHETEKFVDTTLKRVVYEELKEDFSMLWNMFIEAAQIRLQLLNDD